MDPPSTGAHLPDVPDIAAHLPAEATRPAAAPSVQEESPSVPASAALPAAEPDTAPEMLDAAAETVDGAAPVSEAATSAPPSAESASSRPTIPATTTLSLATAYDLSRQPITIVIQLLPATEAGASRPVIVSLRCGSHPPRFHPLIQYADLGPLPPVVTRLLQELQLWALDQKKKAAKTAGGTPQPPSPPPASPSPLPAVSIPAAGGPPAPAPESDPATRQLSLF